MNRCVNLGRVESDSKSSKLFKPLEDGVAQLFLGDANDLERPQISSLSRRQILELVKAPVGRRFEEDRRRKPLARSKKGLRARDLLWIRAGVIPTDYDCAYGLIEAIDR